MQALKENDVMFGTLDSWLIYKFTKLHLSNISYLFANFGHLSFGDVIVFVESSLYKVERTLLGWGEAPNSNENR